MLNQDLFYHRLLRFFQNHFRFKKEGAYRSIWQLLHLDPWLLLGLFFLTVVGTFILYSASNGNWLVITQRMIHLLIAFGMMFLLAQITPFTLQRWSLKLYIASILLLSAVLILGGINKGAQRWLQLGFIHFQPSELMTLTLPMALAWYYTRFTLPPKLKDIFVSTIMILIPFFLTVKEPDLGTAIILIISGGCILLLAGISWRFILSVILLVSTGTPLLFHFLHDYQKERILTFFNPERNPLGAGYHIIQSKIALGSGGFLGKGFMQGTQTHLYFLPEHTTDFIFAVCGEDFGFIGCLFLILLYLLVIARCFYIATQARDTYSRLLAGGLSLTFFLSLFVNIGMVSGLLPVVGLPLPLISYGGSSTITLMASFGILMSIHRHHTLLKK